MWREEREEVLLQVFSGIPPNVEIKNISMPFDINHLNPRSKKQKFTSEGGRKQNIPSLASSHLSWFASL